MLMASTNRTPLTDAKGRWRLSKHTFRLEEAMEALGLEIQSEQADGELVCRCILSSHSGPDNSPSLIVNKHTLKWCCRSCHAGSRHLPSLVVAIWGWDYVAAIDWLCKFTDQRNPKGAAFVARVKKVVAMAPDREPVPERNPVLPWIPMSALDKFNHPTDYYAERGISAKAVAVLRLGFNPQHSRPSARYVGPAAIIPHIFKGELVGWQERWLDYRDGWNGPPKYTNTNDFPKQESLYNYDLVADNYGEAIVVVESAMTVAKLLTAGIPAVATFGASVTPSQLRLLKQYQRGVLLAFDNDGSGDGATKVVGDIVSRHTKVWVVPPPEGDKADLGDLSPEEIHAQMKLRQPYIVWASGLNNR